MNARTDTTREFKGRHMLAIMLAFFAVIIGVNVTMAVFANSSWTGLVVKNSYVASQEFNGHAAQARQQAALGYVARLRVENGAISYSLADAQGRPIALKGATARFGRPVSETEDQTLTLTPQPDGGIQAAFPLRDGLWVMELLADAGLEHPWRDVRRVVIAGGVLK
jgi:nitrogen fixation protein FixH